MQVTCAEWPTMYMVMAYMQRRNEKMTMVMPRGYDFVHHFGLYSLLSIQSVQARKSILVDIYFLRNAVPNTFYNNLYIFSTNSEAQCPLLQICFYELAPDLLIHL